MDEFWLLDGLMVCMMLDGEMFLLFYILFASLGMISCWVVDGKTRPMSTFSSNAQHNSEVTVLKWNPAGKRLITGDKVSLT